MKNRLGHIVVNDDPSHMEASSETWAITGFGLVALVLLAALFLHLAR